MLSSSFWPIEVEDNAFCLLRTAEGVTASLHASWTQWKNLFSFEIYGRNAKLHIEGLGGSYGTERLTHYQMLPQMGPPETVSWEYPGEDLSWRREFEFFAAAIERGDHSTEALENARAVLQTVNQIYDGAR